MKSQARESKIFRSTRRANHIYNSRHPGPEEGRIMVVAYVGRDAMDATASGAQGIAGRGFRERSTGARRTALLTVFARTLSGQRVPVERSAEMGADGEVVWSGAPSWRQVLGDASARPGFGCIVNPGTTGAKELVTPGRARSKP